MNPLNATIEDPLHGYFLVCYTAVFRVSRNAPPHCALRGDTKNGCVAD